MTSQELLAKISGKFPEVKETVPAGIDMLNVTVPAVKIAEVCSWLKSDLSFDYLMCLSGVDLKDKIRVVYHLYSIGTKDKVALSADLDPAKAELPSVASVWQAADWHEREAYDMFGVVFTGHPNLTRILTAEGFEGFPLLKNYVAKPDQYD